MFAIPGIIALVAFIYLHPQDVFHVLERLPFLYLFFALVLFGWAVDLRLRVSRPRMSPQLPWVLALIGWTALSLAIKAPEHMVDGAKELAIPVALYLVIAHGVQSFRALAQVAVAIAVIVGFLAVVGVHQGTADWQCVRAMPSSPHEFIGIPDGRPCTEALECFRDPEPGADYVCERVGLFGTISIASGRVRYRGVLQDPNELSLALAIGLPFMFALFAWRKTVFRFAVAAAGTVLVFLCVLFSQSRGGLLVFAAVIAVYVLRRFGKRGVVWGITVAIPMAMLIVASGGDRRDASASTAERLDAWAAGIDIFKGSPLFGVGPGQFTEYHYLTAHNSFILMPAELGFVGFFLWAMVLYVSVRIPVSVLARWGKDPAARVAQVWATAMLAALAGLYVGSFFLSFGYHHVLWIYLGLAGALAQATTAHDPDFCVRPRWWEAVGVGAVAAALIAGFYLYFRVTG
ncbi:MAG TPA: O-antigen ligase family protein [Kofleriaceae bacterium]|nr:O-antigen ligase family protein [Kofleriaceae bacterium]